MPAILHLSDLHLTHIPDICHFASADDLLKAIKNAFDSELCVYNHINSEQKPPQPEYIVISGDFTWQGESVEFRRSQEFIRDLLIEFKLSPKKLIVVPGNHDMRWYQDGKPASKVNRENDYRMFYELVKKQEPNDHLSSYIANSDITILGLNSASIESDECHGFGYVGIEQLDDLWSDVTADDNFCYAAPRVAVLHHHLIPVNRLVPINEENQYSLTLDAEQIHRWFFDNNIKVVLHGHQHQPFLRVVIDPAKMAEQVTVVAGVGSVGAARDKLGDCGRKYFQVVVPSNDNVAVDICTTKTENADLFGEWSSVPVSIPPRARMDVVSDYIPISGRSDFHEVARDLINKAERRIILIGTGLNLLQIPWVLEHVLQMVIKKTNLSLEIHLADPDAPSVEARLIEEQAGKDIIYCGKSGLKNMIQDLVARWNRLNQPTNIKLFAIKHYPTYALFVIDDTYFFYPYGFSRLGNYSPVFRFEKGDSNHVNAIEFFDDHVDRVRDHSTPLQEIAEFKPFTDRKGLHPFAVYFVPGESDPINKFARSVWAQYANFVGNATDYGFHLTVADALYFRNRGELNHARAQARFLAADISPFDLTNLKVQVGPKERAITIGVEDPTGQLEILHCEMVQKIYRRATASVYTFDVANIEINTERSNTMLQRYKAPYVLSKYKPHFTLLTDVPKEDAERIAEELNQELESLPTDRKVHLDHLSLMTQDPNNKWIVIDTESEPLIKFGA